VNISWWVGWVEKNDNVYIFANNLETGYAGIRFSKARIEITRKILKELNILP
jgi:beta-lactamase class D